MFVKSNRGWLLLARIPFRGVHFDEYFGLRDSRDNRRKAKKVKRALEDAVQNGTFESEFRARFPESKNLARFERESTQPTVSEFAQLWLEEQKSRLTPATASHYRVLLKNHLLVHPIARKRISEVNDGDVNSLVAAVRERFDQEDSRWPGLRTTNMVLARLRTIFATAKRRKLIADDPMVYVRNLRQPKPDVDPFDLEEALRLLESAKGWERAFLALLLFTGIRPNEALALRWAQIDWAHALIRVRQSIGRDGSLGLPKTRGSERDVEMIALVRNALQEQRARSQLKGELVFPSASGTPIDLNNFRARNWPRIIRHAGVRERTIYQCRHSFARFLIEQGDTPQHVAAQLGHAGVRMVFEVYGRWLKRPTSAAMEALDCAVAVTHPSPIFGGQSAGISGKQR